MSEQRYLVLTPEYGNYLAFKNDGDDVLLGYVLDRAVVVNTDWREDTWTIAEKQTIKATRVTLEPAPSAESTQLKMLKDKVKELESSLAKLQATAPAF